MGDEIKRNQNLKINVADFFAGDRWRVHPFWVYCRFHYLEDHEFETPEEEITHFLNRLDDEDWRWTDQYEAYQFTQDEVEEETLNCGRKTLNDDDYYCNKELMQLLVFDAKATNNSFAGRFTLSDPRNKRLADIYKTFLRFVATQSGLTRWQYLEGAPIPLHQDKIIFGDLHRRAVNEPWYKGALFQHNEDPNSIYITGT